MTFAARAAFLLFASILLSLPASAETTRPVNLPHPLLYDAQLGIYGQSDHVGIQYPFSPEALAQKVPDARIAAGQFLARRNSDVILQTDMHAVATGEQAAGADAAMAAAPDGTLHVAWTEFRGGGEDIFVRSRTPDGTWGEPVRLTERRLADYRPTIAADGSDIWVVWCRRADDGSWPLVGRRHDGEAWRPETIVASGRNHEPVLKANPAGGYVGLAYESWNSGESRVHVKAWMDGGWRGPVAASDEPGAQQRPALAFGSAGTAWLAWDVVVDRRYEVRLARWGGVWRTVPNPPAIRGHRQRASIAVDGEENVWVLPETHVLEPIQVRRAFNGQDQLWNIRPAARSMMVWTGQAWKFLPKGPAMTNKAGTVHVDAHGTVWCFGRTPGGGTRDFLLVGNAYRGDAWRPAGPAAAAWDGTDAAKRRFVVGGLEIGSLKQKVAPVEHDGRLYLATQRTHRRFTNTPAWTYGEGAVDTIVHEFPIGTDKLVRPKLVEFDPAFHGTDDPKVRDLPHAKMGEADYTAVFDGVEMDIYYGDMHHHTEYSRDPGVMNDDVDGNHRYVRDIRELDFEGLADHAEHISDHDWYRIRRTAGFYNQGEHFAAMPAFEWTSEFYREGNYQEGHHNIVFRTDGHEVKHYSASVPASNTPLRLIERLEEDIAEARRHDVQANAFVFPHDPSRWVQPISWSWYNPRIKLLELVQSRGAHELAGGPQKTPLRNDFQQQLAGKSAQDGLAKGLRWGFAGNGDHVGALVTGVYAPAGDRESLFDAMYAKRTFATTGAKMAVNFSVNEHPMGSEWRGSETDHIVKIEAVGTSPITLVDLWKNGRLLWRWSPESPGMKFRATFKDPSAPWDRENYWYVRVQQADGHLAWSSPVWFVYDGVDAEVIADAGGPEPHYLVPNLKIPLPVLMRNQKDHVVEGRLTLTGLPDGWVLEPDGPIHFQLPADSWTTYVWYLSAPQDALTELKAYHLDLTAEYDDATPSSSHIMPVVQSPRLLNPRGQLSELNDALFLQRDLNLLNQWLKVMSEKWGFE